MSFTPPHPEATNMWLDRHGNVVHDGPKPSAKGAAMLRAVNALNNAEKSLQKFWQQTGLEVPPPDSEFRKSWTYITDYVIKQAARCSHEQVMYRPLPPSHE